MEKDIKQIKTAVYEEEKINQVLNILNTLPIVGVNNIKGIGYVFDVLTNPISNEETKNKTV